MGLGQLEPTPPARNGVKKLKYVACMRMDGYASKDLG